MNKSPTALIILDGFGYSPEKQYNAIAQAKKPMFDFLMQHYPHTLLAASGSAVGLPKGCIGNSEVGHITLGAGRIVPSAFLQLQDAIASGAFFSNPVLVTHLQELTKTKNTLHILGLLSDAGVQNHQEIMYALIKAGIDNKIKKIVIHAFLDGRDMPPKSAVYYLEHSQQYLKQFPTVSLGSITGRYYAMDRDNDWDRTNAAYQMLIGNTKPQFSNWRDDGALLRSEYY